MSIYFDPDKQAQSIERAKAHFRKKEYLEGMYLLAGIVGAACASSHPEAAEIGSEAFELATRCFNYLNSSPETSARDIAMLNNVYVQMDLNHALLRVRSNKA